MWRMKRINDLESLRRQATTPPLVIMEAVETAAERTEPWWVLQLKVREDEDPFWLAVFPEEKKALFFNGEETMKGRWDEARNVFFEEDGPTWSLEGRPVTVSALEDEAAEEDAGIEEDRARRERL
ncbi:MAG: hypothetical protein IPP78_04070 [Holophagaceae bacterium]|nr:hypothetical protein [Holophagaceae bacterium]